VGGLDHKVRLSGTEVGLFGRSAGGRNILQTLLINIECVGQLDIVSGALSENIPRQRAANRAATQ
jgi:predicted alpha/beta superfamily hydrolase